MDYIDSSLPEELQAPVSNPVENCPTCAGLHKIYRETIGIRRAIVNLVTLPTLSNEWVNDLTAIGVATR